MGPLSSSSTPAMTPNAHGCHRLDGKAALITGAGTGIGEAIAHKFAYEGASVLLNGLPGDPLEEVASDIREQYPNEKVAVYEGDAARRETA